MTCIFLLGFSTTGKSSILRDFAAEYRNRIDTLDSDQEISQSDGGHIYSIYLKYRDKDNSTIAILEIEEESSRFLRTVALGIIRCYLLEVLFFRYANRNGRLSLAGSARYSSISQKTPEDVLADLWQRRLRHR